MCFRMKKERMSYHTHLDTVPAYEFSNFCRKILGPVNLIRSSKVKCSFLARILKDICCCVALARAGI